MIAPPFALARTLNNVAAFCNCVGTISENTVGGELSVPSREEYFRCLNLVQEQKFPFDVSPGALPRIETEIENGPADDLWRIFLASNDVGDTDGPTQFNQPVLDCICSEVSLALKLLDELNETAGELIRRLVATLLIADVPGVSSASVARVVGVVWLCPKAGWSTWDFAESLLHEATHQDLFVDDMTNGLFTVDRATLRHEPESRVVSAIRRTRRAYFDGFHAAGVATNLLWFYNALGATPRIPTLLNDLTASLEMLGEKRGYLTASGLERLESMAESVRKMAGRPLRFGSS